MRRNHEQLRISASRQAFTLVELLVVCAVIATLVAMTLIVVSKVTASAKITTTRATIQKIDVAIQQIFESYEDKFLVFKNQVVKDYPDLDKEIQLRIAVHFLRDTMRMEMPHSWGDVQTGPLKMNGEYVVEDSPLREYYLQRGTASSAALLFLIIQNLNPEALEAFHGSEVADVDGFSVFVDAWGRPIQFLRWTPAFTDSDLQPNVSWGNVEAAQKAAKLQPFLLGLSVEDVHTDWFLYPLIYSAGPDGVYGIEAGSDSDTPVLKPNGEIDPYAFPYGMPDGSGKHFDNIHNHRWFRSF